MGRKSLVGLNKRGLLKEKKAAYDGVNRLVRE
jgi:hypothetical protein